MMLYLIKSGLSLLILYLFFKIFLAKENLPVFKRFFLLGAIVFSYLIPLTYFKFLPSAPALNYSQVINYRITGIFTNVTPHVNEESYMPLLQNIYYWIYLLGVIILATRFLVNYLHLSGLHKHSPNSWFKKYRLILIKQKILPYSFLSTIFVNEQEYNEGKISKELLLHEVAHIEQKHSLDIIFAEFLQIIFWFNPLLWLMKNEIRVNHEYLADKEVVLSCKTIKDYQEIILNVVFRNNSSYLASSFNYSLTKKRLFMLTKEKSKKQVFLKVAMLVPVVIILSLGFSFAQNTGKNKQEITETRESFMNNMKKEWWYPILQKHNKEPRGFNNFRNIFEMGEGNSIDNGICKLTNAFMIIRDSADNYVIIESPLIIHDLQNEVIKADAGTIKKFRKDSDPNNPIEVYQIEKMELHAVKN